MLGPSTWLIYFLFKKLQGWMGKKVSIFPGEEMMEAVRLAGRRKIKVAFIDQDVRLTFLNMKTVSVKEKMKLIWFLLKGLTLGYAWSKIRRQEGIDLSKVPSEELVEEAMGLLRKDFPQIYRVLVTDRDAFMAKNLSGLSGKFKSIVAVVGAGHQKGISSFLGQKKAP
jgi:pheromone shutdown protein TraB